MLSGLMPLVPAGLALNALATSLYAWAGSSATSTLTPWSSVSKPTKVLAATRPTSGARPTRTPGGKTGSPASADELAAIRRATAVRNRRGFMKNLLGLLFEAAQLSASRPLARGLLWIGRF